MAVMKKTKPISRSDFGALVSYLSSTSPEFSRSLGATDKEGQRVIIPALGSNSLLEVSELARQAGGVATLVILQQSDGKGGRVTVANLVVNDRQNIDGDCDVPVTNACTLEDLIKILMPGTSMTFRAAGEEFEFNDVSTRDIEESNLVLR